MRCSLQEKDKRHGLTSSNVVIIKFHKKFWVAGDVLLKKQDPSWGYLIAGGRLGFVGNLMGAVLMEIVHVAYISLACTPPISVEHTESMVIDINHTF